MPTVPSFEEVPFIDNHTRTQISQVISKARAKRVTEADLEQARDLMDIGRLGAFMQFLSGHNVMVICIEGSEGPMRYVSISTANRKPGRPGQASIDILLKAFGVDVDQPHHPDWVQDGDDREAFTVVQGDEYALRQSFGN